MMNTNPQLYPLLFEPALHAKVWGGRQLETRLHKTLPPGDPIGESWEIYYKNCVSNGPLKGKTLSELIAAYPVEMVGKPHADPEFPLLIKFIDAQAWLSVQVHPDDKLAAQLEGQPRGKTECWYVVDAVPGAQLAYGLAEPLDADSFRKAIAEGRTKDVIQYVDVAPGDCLYVPAGALHALGPGILIYELQQTSDTTYRVYDWDRMGLDGKPRELHIEKSLISTHYDVKPQAKVTYNKIEAGDGVYVANLIESPYFALDQLWLDQQVMNTNHASFTIEEAVAHTLSIIKGNVTLRSPDKLFDPIDVAMGQSAFIPDCIGYYQVDPQGEVVILQALLPQSQ
ncbi:MAG: class I mannose-6-phosphate isomerase [Anaerolineae bacterium]|nr:class I mannose-6-phosphate isomerase [Anaerolineae bacterium]